MFRFYNLDNIYFLVIIPLLIILFIIYKKRKEKLFTQFAGKTSQDIIVPFKSKYKNYYKFILVMLSICFIVIALARPQYGTKIEEVKTLGIDIYVLLDVSNSMMTQDLKPSRLEQSKYGISEFIKKLSGDRFGMVVFAGDSFVQIPLTTDYNAANLLLENIDCNSIASQGTNIGSAFELALKSFDYSKTTKKVIILISDGEDHEGELTEQLNLLKEKGIVVYTIGMGSVEGALIPEFSEGRISGFKRDASGNTILSKLDEALLKNISEKTSGKYFYASGNQDELNLIYKDLTNYDKTEFGSKKVTEYEDKYYLFIIPAFFFLLVEIFISDKKSVLLQKLVNKYYRK